jgi:transposase
MYLDERMTSRQIASILDVDSKTVCRWLAKSGVTMRNSGSEVISALSEREWLVGQYVAKHKSTTEIAKELGCSARSVSLWLRRHGIQARPTGREEGHTLNRQSSVREKMSLAKRGKFIGSENPNWRGGIQLKDPERGRYRYKMWTKAIKDRDGWACTKCGSETNLHSHHIKRWCDHPELRYDLSNGVTLCHPCHEIIHGDGYKFRWPKHAEISKSASASREV